MKTYNGIICGHAYSILGAYEYGGERLVKIRNPWSGGEYTGEWSDKDTSKWDTNAKQQLDHSLHSGTNDGVFFMPLNKFTEFFERYIASYELQWRKKVKTVTISGASGRTQTFNLNNPVSQKMSFGVSGFTGTYDRWRRTPGCDLKQMFRGAEIRVKNSRGQAVRDFQGHDKLNMGGWYGFAFLVFDNVPAGRYTATASMHSTEGRQQVGVITYGLKQPVRF